MCGISGLYNDRLPNEQLRACAATMTQSLAHRGPDDDGIFVDQGIALGHRRLSILDLSEAGHQPMASSCGRYMVVYNGEIYNYRELRDDLIAKGFSFRGTSDSEVLVNSLSAYGVSSAISRWNGMYAVAVWDRQRRQVHLIRDSVGIKPLYYRWTPDTLAFGSEIKAIQKAPGFNKQLCRSAIRQLMQVGYIYGEQTVYQDVYRALPGQHLVFDCGEKIERADRRRHWIFPRPPASNEVAAINDANTLDEQFHELLRQSVGRRLVADVKVGTFLSGGLDSSLITALATELSSGQLTTITMGFAEAEYDESQAAQQIASHLGTEHICHQVTADDALALVEELPRIYDEPFADSSQIPTIMLSRIAREHVTVCLSGDGGDELFGGYRRYEHIDGIRARMNRIPKVARRLLSFGPVSDMITRLRGRPAGTQGVLQSLLAERDAGIMYEMLNAHWRESIVIGDDQWPGYQCQKGMFVSCLSEDYIHHMMFQDAGRYLPEDILVKVDRASMSCGLEVRVPMLDTSVVEMVQSAPAAWKFSSGNNKLPIRKLLSSRIPQEILQRPKQGFGVPIDHWLRGPLRDWAEDLLSVQRLQDDGIFQPDPIREKWQQHLEGTIDWHYLLWDVLMFQSWWDEHR